MKTRRFWPWVIAAIALVALSVVLHTRQPARASTAAPASFPPAAQSAAVPVDELLLEEKRIDQIAARVIEAVAAQSAAVSSQAGATSGEDARAADSLKRDLGNYRKEVQVLSQYMKDLLIYIKEIEYSLSIIDTGLSTPSVLRKQLEPR